MEYQESNSTSRTDSAVTSLEEAFFLFQALTGSVADNKSAEFMPRIPEQLQLTPSPHGEPERVTTSDGLSIGHLEAPTGSQPPLFPSLLVGSSVNWSNPAEKDLSSAEHMEDTIGAGTGLETNVPESTESADHAQLDVSWADCGIPAAVVRKMLNPDLLTQPLQPKKTALPVNPPKFKKQKKRTPGTAKHRALLPACGEEILLLQYKFNQYPTTDDLRRIKQLYDAALAHNDITDPLQARDVHQLRDWFKNQRQRGKERARAALVPADRPAFGR